MNPAMYAVSGSVAWFAGAMLMNQPGFGLLFWIGLPLCFLGGYLVAGAVTSR